MADRNNNFEPDETIQKVLVSTTSRLVGEYVHDALAIMHAWPLEDIQARTFETPVSRSSFIVAFATPPYTKQAGVVVPDYSPHGEAVAACLSVLFGKRFDMHGLVESVGHYRVPDFTPYAGFCDPTHPFNSHEERTSFPVELNLDQFHRIERMVLGGIDERRRSRLNAACKFYMQALRHAERNAEVAYLHLITAGEILSGPGLFQYSKEERLAPEDVDDLKAIESCLQNGRAIAKRLTGKLLGIKRTFVRSLLSLLDESFYTERKGGRPFGYFRPDDMKRRVSAAYDLRSRYVHSGVPFGNWIAPARGRGDVQIGRPIVQDGEFAKILERAPTFAGLERMMRYCLLRYMASHGVLAVSPGEPTSDEPPR